MIITLDDWFYISNVNALVNEASVFLVRNPVLESQSYSLDDSLDESLEINRTMLRDALSKTGNALTKLKGQELRNHADNISKIVEVTELYSRLSLTSKNGAYVSESVPLNGNAFYGPFEYNGLKIAYVIPFRTEVSKGVKPGGKRDAYRYN